MRVEVSIDVRSAAQAIRFYVGELGLFDQGNGYGQDCYLLLARDNSSIGVPIAQRPGDPTVFGLRVADCAGLFGRLRRSGFASGGRIVEDLAHWPGMNSFVLHDPSGNRVVIFDEGVTGVTTRLDVFLRVTSSCEAARFYVETLGALHPERPCNYPDTCMCRTDVQCCAPVA
ncbi:MAG: VOC family protein [Telluria sp.]